MSSATAGCTAAYSLFKDDGTGTYVAYSDSNVSVDNIALNPAANPTQILITTSATDDAALDG